jgi:hypothetical protein
MNKMIIALMAICFQGDPYRRCLAWLGDQKLDVVTASLSLVNIGRSVPD